MGKKNNKMLKLKVVIIEKLQKGLLQAKNWNMGFGSGKEKVSEDVKEGHFAVIAFDGYNEERRFVVPLAYLDRPCIQRLLERAAEEYGFDHEGALMVPCSPMELEWMLTQEDSGSGDEVGLSFM
ncbi:auxin-induced protein 15A-like [Bidens hawaiensis]|uniref:auxin-induced protein 15A-like n=1 Tax=Bidens hawaiensis TaxID=980011 RepID=UPI0040492DBF